MAALGAGAGAYKGSMERDELAEKRRQADLEDERNRQALAQRNEQFQLNMGQEQAAQAENTRRFDMAQKTAQENTDFERNRIGKLDAQNAEQTKYSRGRDMASDALSEKKMQMDQSKTAFDQGRATKSDAWAEAVNGLTMEQKQQEIEQNNLTLETYRTAARTEKEQMANRQKLANSNFGAAVMSMVENGGYASPSTLDILNKATGQKIQKMYQVEDKGVVVEYVGDDGKPATEFKPMDVINKHMTALYGDKYSGGGSYRSSGSSSSGLAQGRFDLALGESLLKNLERRIDTYQKQIDDNRLEKGDPGYTELKSKLLALQSQYDTVSNDVYGEMLGTGGDTGGTGSAGYVNPNQAYLDRLGKLSTSARNRLLMELAEEKKTTPSAILAALSRGEDISKKGK